MNTRRDVLKFSTGLAAASLMGSRAFAQSAPQIRGVVELFTSQGCSSCPPADKLINELAQDLDLITLSLPVDYWDYLGWKDTLASPLFTQRQKAYAAMRGDRQIYTPQAVMNGATHGNGSDRTAIERALKASSDKGLSLGVKIAPVDGGYRIACDAGSAVLTAVPFVRSRNVKIGRGENSGRSITYSNVALAMLTLGQAGSQSSTHLLEAAKLPAGTEGIVVLAQTAMNGKLGRIVGAARHLNPTPA